jgi:predicted permease
MRIDRKPPAIGRWLLRLWPLGARRVEIEADLLALYAIRLRERGAWFAGRRFVADAASLWRCRDTARASTGRSIGEVSTMFNDVIFAVRLYRRNAGLFALTVAGLAVAIGISTSAFSVVRAVAFAGYGAADSESSFHASLESGIWTRVTGDSPFRGDWAFADYQRLRGAASLSTLVASKQGRADYRPASEDVNPLPVPVLAVSGDYFSVLGLRTVLGRTLTPTDDVPGGDAVVVSQGFWKNRMGEDPAVVGKTVWLGDRSYTIVGVAHRRHSSTQMKGFPPAFWITLSANAERWTGSSTAGNEETRAALAALKSESGATTADLERLALIERELSAPIRPWNPAVGVHARLKPGVTKAQAESEIRTIAATAVADRPADKPATVLFEPLDKDIGGVRRIAAILMALVALIVLLACANVTNVLLASAATRRREIGTRFAIGASGGRILRQLLTESLLLGAVSSVLGLLMASWILPSFAAMIQVPSAVDVTPDLGVYAFVAAVTCVIGIVAGFAPARYGQRSDLTTALKTDQLSAPLPLPRARLRGLLIGIQAATSVILLVVAALLARSSAASAMLDPGYDARGLVNVTMGDGARGPAWSRAQRDAYRTSALDRIRSLPGVRAAALTSAAPFHESYLSPHRLLGRSVDRADVSADYFEAMGIPIRRGRAFTADEVRNGAPVVILSASLARAAFGSADPIGAGLDRVWGPAEAADKSLPGLYRKPRDARIVGVAADATIRLGRERAPTIYMPLDEGAVPMLVVRVAGDPAAVVRQVRDALRSLDPRIRPTARLVVDQMHRQAERPAILAQLATWVSGVALGLAVIGLFGVTSFVVENRRHEISVRRALGATDSQLVQALLIDSLRPVAIGLTCGVLMALAGGRLIDNLLYGTSARDPLAIAQAIGILVAAAALAVYLPARRTIRVDPVGLLKSG